MVNWDDGPQQAAFDSGWQHVPRRVLSQQASDGVGPGLGVDDVAVMTDLLVSGYEKESRGLDGFDQG